MYVTFPLIDTGSFKLYITYLFRLTTIKNLITITDWEMYTYKINISRKSNTYS